MFIRHLDSVCYLSAFCKPAAHCIQIYAPKHPTVFNAALNSRYGNKFVTSLQESQLSVGNFHLKMVFKICVKMTYYVEEIWLGFTNNQKVGLLVEFVSMFRTFRTKSFIL